MLVVAVEHGLERLPRPRVVTEPRPGRPAEDLDVGCRGETLEQLLAQKQQTAEGVKSCRSILDLARKHDVDMPITEQVVAVVHEGRTPADMVRAFMTRDAKSE